MSRTRVLFVSHNHPSVRPGGAEAYAHELYRLFRASDDVEPFFLSRGPGRARPGSCVSPVAEDPHETFLHTDGYDYDWLNGTITQKDFYTRHVRAYLRAVDPDVVHVQHTLFLGFDLLREIRTSCPRAAILYTLHEFLPICHRQGQMVRRVDDEELCTRASPRRCHECFPEVSPAAFARRTRFIQAQFEVVDRFLVPSRLLLERYASWGLPREKLLLEEYGRLPVAPLDDGRADEPRTRFGFFGQLSPFKGVHVLLDAMRLLSGPGEPLAHLRLHGANLELQDRRFQDRVRMLLEQTTGNVTWIGSYTHDQQRALMQEVDWVVVPSTWWENSPLVIQEAFQYGRPVLCSDIGGMAEKVEDGVNGLHFRVGDAVSLAATLRRAVGTPGLWQQLRDGIPPVHLMTDHGEVLRALYGQLVAETAEREQRGRAG